MNFKDYQDWEVVNQSKEYSIKQRKLGEFLEVYRKNTLLLIPHPRELLLRYNPIRNDALVSITSRIMIPIHAIASRGRSG